MDGEECITKFVSWPWCAKKERITLVKKDWAYLEEHAFEKGLSLSELYFEIYQSTSRSVADETIESYLKDFLNRQRERDEIARLGLTPANDNDEFQLWEPAEKYFLSQSLEEIIKKSRKTYQLRCAMKLPKIILLFRSISHPKYLVSE